MTDGRQPMYLSQFDVSNFRSYGSDFRIQLPARPGVLLLSGRNGLGKTSFFEATEWCLTGSILRMKMLSNGKMDPGNLCRKGASEAGFRVGLQFAEADKMFSFRREQFADEKGRWLPPTGTDVQEIARRLSYEDAGWSLSPENLSRYLHLTHLYPQTSAVRLITQSPKDRWTGISDLAGVGLFELVRTQLTNSKRSLTDIKKRANASHEAALRRNEDWKDLLVQRKGVVERLGAAGRGLPRSEIRGQLVAAAHKFPTNLVVETQDTTLSVLLSELRSAARKWSERIGLRRSGLGQLREVPARWSEISQKAESESGRLVRLDKESEQLVVENERLQSTLVTGREALELLTTDLRELERRHVLSVRLNDSKPEYEAATVRCKNRETEIADGQEKLLVLIKSISSLEGLLSRRKKLEQRARQAVESLESVKQAQARLASLEAVLKRSTTTEEERTGLQKELGALADNQKQLDAEQLVVREQLETAKRTLEQEVSSAEAFARAVAEVASYILNSHKDCPVCETHFEVGELQRRAVKSADSISPDMAVAEGEIRRLEKLIVASGDRLAELAQRSRRLRSELKSLDEVLFALRTEQNELLSDELIQGSTLDERLAALRQFDLAARAEQEAVSASLEEVDEIDQLKESLLVAKDESSEVARFIRELEASKRRAAEFISEWDSELRSLVEVIGVKIDPTSLVQPVADLADEVAVGRRQLGSQRASTEIHEAELRNVSERQEVLKVGVRDTTSMVEELRATLDDQVKRWDRSGLEGSPSESAIDEQLAGLANESAAHENVQQMLDSVGESLSYWEEDQSLQNIEKRIRERSEGREPNDVLASLEEELTNTKSKLERAERARAAADRLSEVLKSRTQSFNQNVLDPLQTVLRSYLRALVHDERFHSVAMTSDSAGRGGRLRFELELDGDEKPHTTDAEFILSEGQVAGLSLASLLAASSAYRWSNWRALLLDDPTQYNDLIHATALFEVLRNLVLAQKYQVILSTHDPEQSAFFRRKLDASRIPWVECEYLGRGVAGVEYRVERSL